MTRPFTFKVITFIRFFQILKRRPQLCPQLLSQISNCVCYSIFTYNADLGTCKTPIPSEFLSFL
ncbi:hypothetical protein QWZ13_00415 [Reinekea marina]|uniref:hypothetical protein n=1 Tax=Reinekea marina TaxID=1310421 RepID=UPI0025B5F28C|nr:hypothetical protein [Reinekea marina]MDN3647365.1 hypothetical protein [Reinekea marina]